MKKLLVLSLPLLLLLQTAFLPARSEVIEAPELVIDFVQDGFNLTMIDRMVYDTEQEIPEGNLEKRYEWGDGESSTSPYHNYRAAGSYPVQLFISMKSDGNTLFNKSSDIEQVKIEPVQIIKQESEEKYEAETIEDINPNVEIKDGCDPKPLIKAAANNYEVALAKSIVNDFRFFYNDIRPELYRTQKIFLSEKISQRSEMISAK